MGLYKLSSQFTDFVKARSSNPNKILEQVSDAIEDLGEKGYPLPGGASVLEAFHSSNPGEEDVDDQFIMEQLGGERAIPLINMMYKTLGELASTGKIDKVTRNVIETFLKSWKPLVSEERIAPTVLRRKKPEGSQEPKEDIEIPEFESRTRWSSPEDRMIDRLDRQRVASIYDLFTKAGVLESLPGFDERKIRLAERSFEWAKIIK